MDFLKKSGILISFLFLSAILRAETSIESRVLKLDDAISLALENNNDIKIALKEVTRAQAAVDEAFGYALPQVDLSASFSHFLMTPKMAFPDFEAMLGNATYGILFNENVIPFDETKFKPLTTTLQTFTQANNYEAKIQLTQILFNSAVFTGIGTSKEYFEMSKIILKSNITKNICDVKKAFYGILLTKSMLEILNESLINAEDNKKNVEAMHKQGFVSDFDLLQVQVRVENLKPLVVQLENTLKSAKDGLKILLGISETENIDVEGELLYSTEPMPNQEELINTAHKNNFDVQILKYKMRMDKALIEIEEGDYWPTLAAFANYSMAGSSDNLSFQSYSSSIIGLSLSMNLFRGNQTQRRVEKSTITMQQTELQLNQLKEFVAMQIKMQLMNLERVSSQIEAQRRTVSLAQRAYELSTIRYKEGTGTQLEIKNADMELRTAKSNLLQSIYDFLLAKTELEKLLSSLDSKYFTKFEEEFNKR